MTKSAEAFRSISEAADELGVAQHVLRFWETRFSFVKPMKRAGGRRFYRPADIAVLSTVRRLLHDEGYTIKGVQKLYREAGPRAFGGADPGGPHANAPTPPAVGEPAKGAAKGEESLRTTLAEVEAAKARLDSLLGQKRDAF